MPATDMELSQRLLSDGWIKIKEPSNIWTATLLSMPLALILGAILFVMTKKLNPSAYDFLNFAEAGFQVEIKFQLSALLLLVGTFGFMLLHEFIHAMFIPNFLHSNKTFWGMNGLFGFVFTTEEMKKSRYLIISIMPFLVLSILLPCFLAFLHMLNGFAIFLCLLNAMGSCVDFLNVILITFQVPKGAFIRNNGFETYYKRKA